MMEPTPVYICTGFLDSGKTLLVKDTLMEQEWIEPGLTLLILCEEGEEEYSKEYLEENDMVLLKIDKCSIFYKLREELSSGAGCH